MMFARPKTLLTSARNRFAQHRLLHSLRALLREFSQAELRIVEHAWRGTRRPAIRWAARWTSWLGNGAIYPLLIIPMFFSLGRTWQPVAAALLSMMMAHLVYPWLKRSCARCRPCNLRDSLEPLLASLDEHSFPSGHAMTLSAATVPMVVAMPGSWPLALGIWLAMGWARVACAHHYPSDILAGGVLGAAIAWPVSMALVIPG